MSTTQKKENNLSEKNTKNSFATEVEKRQFYIRKFIKSNPRATQYEICESLKNNKIYTSQATITRELKTMGYKKIDGKYTKVKTTLDSEHTELLKKIIIYNQPRIFGPKKNFYQVLISTTKGTELMIANLITELYGNKIFGAFAGTGCVMIITTNKKTASNITEKLRYYKKLIDSSK